MFKALKKWLFPSEIQEATLQLYTQLVEKARNPVFYTDYQVPDTLDGRFEMILLHLFLHNHAHPDTQTERALGEAFFQDMDRSLREIGVSDTGVGKRIKRMARAYFGRLKAYAEAYPDNQTFAEAIARNVYGTVQAPGDYPAKLVAYVREQSF